MMGKRKNYLIIPSLDLKEMILNKELSPKKGDPNIINIFIKPDLENNKWIHNGKGKTKDFTKYWNNFDCLVFS